MVFTINGVDVVSYVAHGGFKWQRNDVDPDTTRTLDASLRRKRVATKIRLDITCRPLTTKEASVVLKAILPKFVEVTYTDPMEGTEVTKTMYSNNIPALYCIKQPNGLEWWNGITFPLIEK